jgi:hypothetical protein
MHQVALVIIAVSSLIIFYTDLKSRYINALWVLVLGAAIGLFTLANYRGDFLRNSLINLGFLLLLLFLLKMYFSIRNKRFVKIINRYIGVGDLMLFVALSIGYNLNNFIVILILGCLLSLFYYSLLTFLLRKKIIRIPLAGILAMTHFAILISCDLLSFDPIHGFLLDFL